MELSKTQAKRAQRLEDQQEFIKERRKQQLYMLEQAYQVGLKIYEDNKDKLSPEDTAQIEAMKEDQLKQLEALRAQIG